MKIKNDAGMTPGQRATYGVPYIPGNKGRVYGYAARHHHPPVEPSEGRVDAKAAGLSAVLTMLVFALGVDAALVIAWLTS
jgi:hypothetical protein